jgi:mono/diheme cytochrome c family protein
MRDVRPWLARVAPIAALGLAVAGSFSVRAQERAPAAGPTQLARGEQVFTYWCATCHAAGPGMPGTQALQAKYQGSLQALLLERADLTPELIAFFVRNGISVMPHFRKTESSDADLDARSAYIVTTARASR